MCLLIFIPLVIIAGVGETIAQVVKNHPKGPSPYRRPKPHTFN